MQKIGIYTPVKAHGLPITGFVHGGFVNGNKKNYANVPIYLSQHGIVAVNVNYRLARK